MSILLAIGVILVQVASGVVILCVLLGQYVRSFFLTLGMGIALGTFLSMISSVLLQGTLLESLGWAIPFVFACTLAGAHRKKFRQSLSSLTSSSQENIALLLTLAVGGLLMIIGWVRTPISAIRAGGSVDMYFLEALSRGITNFGPAHSILMADGSLRYHWFTYAWAGNISDVASLESFVALTRVLPAIALIGATLIAVGWAGSLNFGQHKSPWWVPTLAGLLVTVGGYSGALYGVILNSDSPSQSLSVVWLLALSLVFITFVSPVNKHALRTVEKYYFLLIGATLAFATIGGKASTGIVALGAMAVTTVAGFLLRQPWKSRALIFTLVTFFAAGIAYLWVLSGIAIDENLTEQVSVKASTWQGLDPIVGRWGVLLGTTALILAVTARVAGLGWLLKSRESVKEPSVIFAVGAMATGISAILLLSEGINELWFVLAASAPAAIIAAYGSGQAASQIKRPLTLASIAAIPASAVTLLLSRNWGFSGQNPSSSLLAWPGVLYWLAAVSIWTLIPTISLLLLWNRKSFRMSSQRLLISVVAISVIALPMTSLLTRPAALWTQYRTLTTEIGMVTPNSLTVDSPNQQIGLKSQIDDQLAGSEWLLGNSSPKDLIATSEPTSAQIPALTGRQMYLGGSIYQLGLGSASESEIVRTRFELSERLGGPNWSTALETICSNGVEWFWIEGNEFITSSFEPSFKSNGVSIFARTTLCT